MMLGPRVVDPLDVGRGIERDRIVVRITDDMIVDPARAVIALDREGDVALAAGETLGARLGPPEHRLRLVRLFEGVSLVVVKVYRRVGDVRQFTCCESHPW